MKIFEKIKNIFMRKNKKTENIKLLIEKAKINFNNEEKAKINELKCFLKQ